MQLIQFKEYKKMPWKNGLGFTYEIDKDPLGLYRMSSATVEHETSFSNYKGFKRVLTVWKGEGLKLNEQILPKKSFYHFDGADDIICKNISDVVQDLGIIYDDKKFKLACSNLEFSHQVKIQNNSDIQFIFLAEGKLQASQFEMAEGDTLKICDRTSIILSSKLDYNLIYIFSLSTC